MYNKMDVVSVRPNAFEKSINIHCRLDVLESSANEYTIQITEYETRERIECDYEVSGKNIKVNMVGEIKPNTEYLVRINNIESIVGDKLQRTIRQKFVFESVVTSLVEILSPSDYEKLDDITIVLRELNENKDNLTNIYEVQISNTNDFVRKKIETVIHGKTSFTLQNLEDGQYYVRARAIKDSDYGLWSETITFHVEDKEESIEDEIDEDDIIFQSDLNIIERPKNNTTPEKFVFKFDEELLDDIDKTNVTIEKRRL